MGWRDKPGNWQGPSAPGDVVVRRGTADLAVSTYRRANGSQATVVRPRRPRRERR